MINVVKIVLGFLFFVCLAKMPYGYYQFTRFAAFIGFAYLGYKSYAEYNKGLSFIYIALAILFQPLFKIYLGRTLWNIVDVAAGVFLFLTIVWQRRKIKEKQTR